MDHSLHPHTAPRFWRAMAAGALLMTVSLGAGACGGSGPAATDAKTVDVPDSAEPARPFAPAEQFADFCGKVSSLAGGATASLTEAERLSGEKSMTAAMLA